MTFRIIASLGLFTLSLGLGGCIGDDKDDATDTAASTGGDTETTGTAGTTGTTDGTAGSGSASATSTAGTTAGTTTAGTGMSTDGMTSTGTTAGTTAGTTGDPGSVAESCAEACTVVYGCFPEEYESEAECVALCVDESTPREPDPACEAAAVAFNACLAGLTCQELADEEGILCLDEIEALEETCNFGGEECIIGVGGGAESCGIIETCRGSSRELACEGDTCRCLEDEVEVATCEGGICSDEIDYDALSQKAFECCGWEDL